MKKARKFLAYLFFTSAALNSIAYSEAYWGLDFDGSVVTEIGTGDYGHGLDLNMVFGYEFSENVAAEVYLTATTGDAKDLPKGSAAPGPFDGSGSDSLYTFTSGLLGLAWDGATIFWSVADWVSLDIFDYVVSAGTTRYYRWKNQDLISSSIIYPRGLQATWTFGDRWSLITGLGVDQFELDGFAGNVFLNYADEESELSFGIYYVYRNDDDENDYGFASFHSGGADFEFTDYLKVNLGIIYSDKVENFGDVSIFGGVEGIAEFGDIFSLAYALYGGTDDPLELRDRLLRENLMVYVEPAFFITDYFSIGIPVEYHSYPDLSAFARNETWIVPTLYFYPAEDMEIWLWVQTTYNIEASSINQFVGLEAIWEF